MSDYLPKFKPGEAFTLPGQLATAAITGGQLVSIAGAPAAADSVTWIGVASKDTAVGQPIGLFTDAVQRLTAATTLTAGTPVKCAAAGQVTTWVSGTDNYDRYVGITLEAIASGAAGAVKLTR